MNSDTNEIISKQLAAAMGVDALQEQGFEPLPLDLQDAAAKFLAGADRAIVSKHSGGKLSRFAAKQRKAKRKAAKMARRRNR